MAGELEILSRTHGIKDIHDLCAKDLMTISNQISNNKDIQHVKHNIIEYIKRQNEF